MKKKQFKKLYKKVIKYISNHPEQFRGPQGIQGERGLQGPKGDKGVDGEAIPFFKAPSCNSL